MPGINTAIGVIAKIIDTLWPSKKAAVIEELEQLEFKYHHCLITGDDTNAAIYRKKMEDLRKKYNLTGGDL